MSTIPGVPKWWVPATRPGLTLLAGLLALVATIGLSDPASSALGYAHDASIHVYDTAADSVQAHDAWAATATPVGMSEGGQGAVTDAVGPRSALLRLSVAANTESGLLKLAPEDSWGNPATLDRHFIDHGADFGVATADEYAS